MFSVSIQRRALLSLLTGVTAVALSYAVSGWSPSFVASPIDKLIVTATPGWIVTLMIENVGEAGHLTHIGLSLAIVVGLFGLLSLAGLRLSARLAQPIAGGALAAGGAWLLATALTSEPALAAAPAVATALFTTIGGLQTPVGEDYSPAVAVDPARRRILATAASALGVTGVAVLGGQRFHGGDPLEAAPNSAGAEGRLQDAAANSLDLASDDLLGLVSPIEEFYNVDIAEFDPEVSTEEWSLTFTGDVGTERTVTYEEVTDMPAEDRLVTLRCVGEQLNGRKLDTAVWTGTPIRPLLESVDAEGNCDCAMLRGRDDYFVQFPIDVLAEGFLVWGMNGRTLPTSHGHPVRVLIPGHWGETNVKWLSEIEMLNQAEDGYWEQRGWEGTGAVNTVAKLWDEGVTKLDDGRIELAGHAYAGTRGIDRVEVSTNGGSSWREATLSEPLPDDDVWRQWRHTFDPDGSHEVVLRATDGEGNLQPREQSDPSPTGSTGWVSRTVTE
jgi:DMSO/TMAO reductase YedYZ molybdopterin-dependent catalytic subunit